MSYLFIVLGHNSAVLLLLNRPTVQPSTL